MTSSDSRTGTVAAERAVALGLGTNLGDRAANLRAALEGLSRIGVIDGVSRLYESEPYGFAAQPRFWNMAVRLRTLQSPAQLLRAVKDLEVRIGRTPTHRMGPRVIDIDILLYDDERVDDAGLHIPHPGLMDRAFVLAPLLDLDPALLHPVTGESLAERLEELGNASLADLGPALDVLRVRDGR
jgi:2-amino-4-hydroxy-6-hydroxymethyldihydropteridine diphosphokinase